MFSITYESYLLYIQYVTQYVVCFGVMVLYWTPPHHQQKPTETIKTNTVSINKYSYIY